MSLANSLATLEQFGSVETIIDVGCGDGVLAANLTQSLTHVKRWILIDRDQMLVTAARQRVTLSSKESIVIGLCGDIKNLPFAGRLPSRSALLVSHVLYYSITQEPYLALENLLRIAKKSGSLLVLVIRTRDHASYRLRYRYNIAKGAEAVSSMESDQIERWLQELNIDFVSYSIYSPLHTRIVIRDAKMAYNLIGRSGMLQDLISFFCHANTNSMSRNIKLEIAEELMEFVDHEELIVPIAESVIVI